MIHLQYFGVGILVLAAFIVVPALIGLAVYILCRTFISGTKHVPIGFGNCWWTGFATTFLLGFVYFIGGLCCVACSHN
jgi:hypothetical protein